MVETISITIAIISIIIAFFAINISLRQMFQPALVKVHYEYREKEMLEALNSLWKVYSKATENLNLIKDRNIGDKLTLEEIKKIKNEIKTIYREKYEAEKKKNKYDFDHNRRLVSHFFQDLLSLYENKILTEKQIQRSFPPNIAPTINIILMPIEEELIDITYEKRPWHSKDEIQQQKTEILNKLEQISRIIERKSLTLDC